MHTLPVLGLQTEKSNVDSTIQEKIENLINSMLGYETKKKKKETKTPS